MRLRSPGSLSDPEETDSSSTAMTKVRRREDRREEWWPRREGRSRTASSMGVGSVVARPGIRVCLSSAESLMGMTGDPARRVRGRRFGGSDGTGRNTGLLSDGV